MGNADSPGVEGSSSLAVGSWIIRAAEVAFLLTFLVTVLSWTGALTDPLPGVLTGGWRDPAFVACWLIGFVRVRGLRNRMRMGALALGVEIVLALLRHRAGLPTLAIPSLGPAIVVFGWLGVSAIRSHGDARRSALAFLAEAALPALFIPPYLGALQVTALAHPLVRDAHFAIADSALGVDPAFLVGRWFASHAWLRIPCRVVYSHLLLGVVVLHLAATRTRATANVLKAFLLMAGIGYLLYHVAPVVGPVYFFRDFPRLAQPLDSLPAVEMIGRPEPRNCVPSLHTAWALLIWMRSRGMPRWARALAGLFAALTLLATLGLGYHYLTDLIIAAPFAVACNAIPEAIERRWPKTMVVPILGLFALTVLVLLFYGFAPHALTGRPGAAWAVAVATAGIAVYGRRILVAAETQTSPQPAPETRRAAESGRVRLLTAVFACSGFAGLVYQVVSTKSLALAFGSQAVTTTAVLATCMGGIAAGTWLGGRKAERTAAPLRSYGMAQLGIALWCAASLVVLPAVHEAYVWWGTGRIAHGVELGVARVVLGGLVVVPPAFLMGLATPFLAKHFRSEGTEIARGYGLLYAANMGGAALGALLADYALVPWLGIRFSTLGSTACSLAAALIALRLAGRKAPPPTDPEPAPRQEPSNSYSRGQGVTAFVLMGGGGAITMFLGTVDVHLLTVVAGTSAYAFSLMLSSFLVALALGASLANRVLLRLPGTALWWLAATEAGVALTVAAGILVWNTIPAYFASFQDYPYAPNFAQREMVRAIVCLVQLLPPGLFIGATFPAAIEVVAGSARDRALARTGLAYATNTACHIAGAFGGLLLLPSLGSHSSLRLVILAAAVLAAVSVAAASRRRVFALVPIAMAGGVVALIPRRFDMTALSNGANVYFEDQRWGGVVDHAESIDGGLTSVAVSDQEGRLVHTLLTNGTFRGDDASDMRAQVGFAEAHLLDARARGSALVIGWGTGVTARLLSDAGFAQVDAVEISQDVVDLANRNFPAVHESVRSRPSVHVQIADGRTFLELTTTRYDLITIDAPSIWSAGAAAFYNREFYQLAKKRLTEGGVLQQRMQLHRLSPYDIAAIMSSLYIEFPNIRVYGSGDQGTLVACQTVRRDPAAFERLDTGPGLDSAPSSFRGSFGTSGELLLAPSRIEPFLVAVAGESWRETVISTDDNCFLEYETPTANVRRYQPSLAENLALLRAVQAGSLSR